MLKITVLDFLLNNNIVSNKNEAIKQIMLGNVIGEGRKITSAHQFVKKNEIIKLKNNIKSFVSRGGDKLNSVFFKFNINIKNKVGIDCGASTGGFTDFLLQNGASNMIAIDVAYGILDDKLRQDNRVICIDRTNIRNLSLEQLSNRVNLISDKIIDFPVDFAIVDLSFISLNNILPVVKTFIKTNGDILVLFKPQFELPKEFIPKGGIVTDMQLINNRLEFFIKNMSALYQLKLNKTIPSQIKGTKGNQEFFIHFSSK
jgi:23S rRNA (cytidine1920-2'-O)/16S rRNA (cytidine1409-2'-O)-methyltransferase